MWSCMSHFCFILLKIFSLPYLPHCHLHPHYEWKSDFSHPVRHSYKKQVHWCCYSWQIHSWSSHIFSIKKSSAHRIWNKYKSSRSTWNLQCSGRPKEVLDQTKHLVVWTATAHHQKPFQEIANEMLLKISTRTVRNLLAEEGYHRWAAWKVLYLMKKHKIDCMQWAQLYKMFNWDKVIWSDSSYIYLGDDCRKVYVTQRTNKELNENYLVPTFKQSSVHVMIWACIMKGRKGLLIVLEYLGGRGGGMNSTQYKDQVLEGVLASFYAKVAQEMGKVYFQQDGAASHHSKLTQNWFSSAGIPLVFHPASSPDLNPIEPVWHELKKAMRALPHPPLW